MKQALFSHFVTLVLGFVIALFMMSKCNEPKVQIVETIQYKFKDTLIVEKEVPVPVVQYVTKREYIRLLDSIHVTDTSIVYYPVDNDSIPLNHYEDSTSTDNIKLVWKADVLGYMVAFNSTITTERDTTITVNPLVRTIIKKPSFLVQVGMSNKLNLKMGLGYKGWIIEPVLCLNPKNSIQQNQIFLTKQWSF